MAETPRGGENGNGLAIWKPVTDLLDSLSTVGVSAADLRGNALQRQMALRQNKASEQAKETLRSFQPSVRVKFAIDCTASMADDTGPVQKTLPEFLNESIADAFGTIPEQVQQQISHEREIAWTRINFGDGSEYKQTGRRIDNPFLTVTEGSASIQASDLKGGAMKVTEQFRSYRWHMKGGANTGESSAEAALAAMDLSPQNQRQLALLQRLLDDCRTLRDTTGEGRGAGDIVPYLENLIAGQFMPSVVQAVANQSEVAGADMLFLVTDEPAIGSIITIEEVEALALQHGLFAIITPEHVGGYWRAHAQSLDAQWFDLDDLTAARANVDGVSAAQTQMIKAIQKQVARTVATNLKQTLLQLTDGSSSRGTSVIRT